ncbi:phytanoyl-CoA dioxygenase family protein [Candidatus Pelagibacter communis]|uniref:phytanoyl-CoA dioxygenase family protein n=1 Tax=Pelagibacter ubique TaxID=198252 RepID=UPI00094DD925|nr:phytanoyl-CoA dioxygenase family protein [Candidatus Pelagibacter ubique]
MNVFTQEFLNCDNKKIVNEIKTKGFFKFENALTQDFINNIIDDVKNADLSLNKNNIAGVYFTHGNQFFLTHMLAASKNFYNYCTNLKVINFCKEIFGNLFRLKALRYYENFGGQHMQWHTDNRRYDRDKGETHTTAPGIIFLAYLSDVEDGEFQYIEKSHIWSGENTHHDYTVDYVEQNFKKDVVGFKGKKGTILIYNSWGVHRAKPTNNKNFVRKTLFFQVEKDTSQSEPILLNAEFLNNLNDDVKMFLGFGKKATNDVYPNTDIYTMPLNKKTFKIFYKWILSRLVLYIPGFLRKKIRKIYSIPSNK